MSRGVSVCRENRLFLGYSIALLVSPLERWLWRESMERGLRVELNFLCALLGARRAWEGWQHGDGAEWDWGQESAGHPGTGPTELIPRVQGGLLVSEVLGGLMGGGGCGPEQWGMWGLLRGSQMVAVTVGGCPHIRVSLGSVGPSGEALGPGPLASLWLWSSASL